MEAGLVDREVLTFVLRVSSIAVGWALRIDQYLALVTRDTAEELGEHWEPPRDDLSALVAPIKTANAGLKGYL